MHILAQAAEVAKDPDTMLSGQYVIALVTAIVGAVLGAFGKGAIQRTIGPQPFEVKERRDPTWAEVAELERRMAAVEAEQRRLRDEMVSQYKEITLSAEKRASRLMGALNGECKDIRDLIGELSKQIYLLAGGQKKP